MSSDIKITRLPNDINPDVLVRKTMKEKYAVCPYCGNKDYVEWNFSMSSDIYKNKIIINEEEWYGYPDGKDGFCGGLIYSIKHRKELMNWRKYIYHCHKCGCKWESKAFPREILTKEEINDIGSLLDKKEEHT